jgi:hypothetical protein
MKADLKEGDSVEVHVNYGFIAKWTDGYKFLKHDTCRGQETVLVTHTSGMYEGVPVRYLPRDIRKA